MKQLTQEICSNVVSLSETLKQKNSVTTRKSNVRAKAEKFSFPLLQCRKCKHISALFARLLMLLRKNGLKHPFESCGGVVTICAKVGNEMF